MRASLLAINIPESYKGGMGSGGEESAPPLIEFYPAFACMRVSYGYFSLSIYFVKFRSSWKLN